MKRSRFTDSQIIGILKQAEGGSPVPKLCREHGISSAANAPPHKPASPTNQHA